MYMFGFGKKPNLILNSNINCDGCIKGVTPTLNGLASVDKWKVDTSNPNKPLSIWGTVSYEEVKTAIEEAGFEVHEA